MGRRLAAIRIVMEPIDPPVFAFASVWRTGTGVRDPAAIRYRFSLRESMRDAAFAVQNATPIFSSFLSFAIRYLLADRDKTVWREAWRDAC